MCNGNCPWECFVYSLSKGSGAAIFVNGIRHCVGNAVLLWVSLIPVCSRQKERRGIDSLTTDFLDESFSWLSLLFVIYFTHQVMKRICLHASSFDYTYFDSNKGWRSTMPLFDAGYLYFPVDSSLAWHTFHKWDTFPSSWKLSHDQSFANKKKSYEYIYCTQTPENNCSRFMYRRNVLITIVSDLESSRYSVHDIWITGRRKRM